MVGTRFPVLGLLVSLVGSWKYIWFTGRGKVSFSRRGFSLWFTSCTWLSGSDQRLCWTDSRSTATHKLKIPGYGRHDPQNQRKITGFNAAFACIRVRLVRISISRLRFFCLTDQLANTLTNRCEDSLITSLQILELSRSQTNLHINAPPPSVPSACPCTNLRTLKASRSSGPGRSESLAVRSTWGSSN